MRIKVRKQKKQKNNTLKISIAVLLVLVTVLGYLNFSSIKQLVYENLIIRTHIKALGVGGSDRQISGSILIESLLSNLTSAFSKKEEAKSLIFDLKFNEFKKIENARFNALEKGRLDTGDITWSEAKVKLGNKKVQAKIRLKGDYLDHLATDKWSFRVNVRKDNLEGMKKFSVQGPYTRDFHSEPLIHMAMREKGILAPRGFYSDVTVNGSHVGLMYVEEHFDESLTENGYKPYGPLLKHEDLTGEHTFFEEKLFWSDGRNLKLAMLNYREAFVGKNIKFEFLDQQLWAKYLAVTFLFKCFHGNLDSNLRYYFHPLTKKYEPISFDNGCAQKYEQRPLGFLPSEGDIVFNMLKIKTFRDKVRNEIIWWKNSEESKDIIKILNEKEKLYRNLLMQDSPFLSKLTISTEHLSEVDDWLKSLNYSGSVEEVHQDFKTILNRQNALEQVLPIVTNDQGNYQLTFNSFDKTKFTIEDISFSIGDETYFTDPRTLDQATNINEVLGRDDLTGLKLSISYVNNFDKRKYRALPVLRYKGKSTIPFQATQGDVLEKYFTIDRSTKKITLEANKKLQIEENLILPNNFELVINEGSDLLFKENKGMIINGGLTIRGSIQNPVSIRGKNSLEGEWSGLLVLGRRSEVNIDHLNFRGGSGRFLGFEYRGAFTVVNSTVNIRNSSFGKNKSEDAVNLNQVQGILDNIVISNTPSDGLDIDFGIIDIKNIKLENIGDKSGADAIDMSKSNVYIENSTITSVTDKGLSVGEDSYCNINKIKIDRALVGFSSKDSSELYIKYADLNNIELASAMAYRKKDHHNGGRVIIEDIETNNSNYISQKKSSITVADRLITSQKVNVDQLYEKIMLSEK